MQMLRPGRNCGSSSRICSTTRTCASTTQNTEAYVAAQVKAGVINEATAKLILEGSLQDIEDNIKMVTGSGSAVPVCIVFPPF